MSLHDVQRIFWAALTWPTGVRDFVDRASPGDRARFEEIFAESADFDRAARVDVYAQAYFWRLHGVLVEQFPLVAWLAGAERFQNLVTQFLLDFPSTDPNIARVGEPFPRFLESQTLLPELSSLVDVARAEWTLCEVLDAEGGPPLRLDALQVVPVEAWPSLRFEVLPTTRLLAMRWDFPRLWRAHRGGVNRRDAQDARSGAIHHLLIYRHDLEVLHRGLEPSEAAALGALVEGATFAEICRRAVDVNETVVSAEMVAKWVLEWVRSSIVAGYR